MEIPKELLDIDPKIRPSFIELYDDFAIVLYEKKFVFFRGYITDLDGKQKVEHL